MLFDEKGMWDVVGEQAPGVVALLAAFGMVLFFLWKFAIRYGDKAAVFLSGLLEHLNNTSGKIDKLVASNSCIPELAKNVEGMASKIDTVAAKMDEWPSDIPGKLKEAQCRAESGQCMLPMMSYDEAMEFLEKKRVETNG